jgi:hypothetical protein
MEQHVLECIAEGVTGKNCKIVQIFSLLSEIVQFMAILLNFHCID